MPSSGLVTHHGHCHCGAVAFAVDAPAAIVVQECNCSICSMSGYWHLIVPAGRFRLLRGQQDLVEYAFNTRVARHFFCRICGIKSFYVPRSNPDGFSVNARCIDRTTVTTLAIEPFDGRDWEQSAGRLRNLSVE